MAKHDQPTLTTTTKADHAEGTTDVPAKARRKVTYVFVATSSASLKIPYAVAVDGAVLPAYARSPRRVQGTRGSFSVTVDEGAEVSLYLNSDAAAKYRHAPVYAVTAGEHDARITITEKKGRHADSDAPVLKPAPKPERAEPPKDDGKGKGAKEARPAAAAKDAKAAKKPAPVDEYTAPLTGDIWMRVSHKYTADEVEPLLPEGTAPEVADAVRSIYDGLAQAELTVTVPARDERAEATLKVTFSDSENPRDNITQYTLLADGLPRVHPGGYAALFNAALDNGIESLNVTSCWRPLLGSIAHRAGLGLDVNYVGKTRMNRQELRASLEGRKPRGTGNGNDADNVSDAEVVAFKAFEASLVEEKKADTALSQASKEARKALANSKLTAEEKAAARKKAEEADAVRKTAGATRQQALANWNTERDGAEPEPVQLFRVSLLKCPCVAQLFDPWFMDSNVRDGLPPEPNMQRGASSSNERLHAHHMHITVHAPGIL